MRMLAVFGLVLGVAMMSAPFVLPRLGVMAPAPLAGKAPAGGGFSPLAAGRGMVAQVAFARGVAAVLPAPAAAVPACAADCDAGDMATPPRAEPAPLPQVASRRTGPGAKFVKVGP